MTLELLEDNGTRLYEVRRDSDLLGYVAVDSTVMGCSRGGLRMVPDLDADEMKDAARSMTLKYGFLGLPQGGAKAGLIGDGEAPTEAKHEQLVGFGQAIKSLLLSQSYIPDSDLGTSAAEVRAMMVDIGARVGKHDWRSTRSGFYTACSCVAAAESSLQEIGEKLHGKRVAVEGFGNVGSNLARLLVERGAKVVAVSTSQGAVYDSRSLDIDQLTSLARQYGSGFVDRVADERKLERSDLLALDVDLLCPCARRHSVCELNVADISAHLVCPGANNPVSLQAESMLAARGVLVVPDFVANSGGVLGGTLEFAGVSAEKVVRIIEKLVWPRTRQILQESNRRGSTPRKIAEAAALERHAEVRDAAENPSFGGRALAAGVEAYHQGLIPKSIVSLLTPLYISRVLRM